MRKLWTLLLRGDVKVQMFIEGVTPQPLDHLGVGSTVWQVHCDQELIQKIETDLRSVGILVSVYS